MMTATRRAFLGATSIWFSTTSAATLAQQRTWRVGFLALPARPEPLEKSRFGAFATGMQALGYIEGKNLAIEWRFAGGKVDRLPELAAELVRLRADAIVGGATPVISAAQRATKSIPIVMATSNDPVGSGFVQSLGRPGGNITGLSNISVDLRGCHEIKVSSWDGHGYGRMV